MAEQQQAQARRAGREGGRWINERPTPEEFAKWFSESIRIDPALDVAKYIGGVVLIPAVDKKAKHVIGFTNTGVPMIEEREELSYVPYAKVESRIDYFWDYLEAHEELVGVIEHVVSPRLDVEPALLKETTVIGEDGIKQVTADYGRPGGLATMVHQLPEGFSVLAVPVEGGHSFFLCATIRVSIYRAGPDGEPKGLPVRTGRGTKQVPLLKKGWGNNPAYADDSSIMKAETGALGRALGFAGIFVIPGSGIATAEDMLESIAQGEVPAQSAATSPDAAGPASPTEAPVRTGPEQAAEDEQALLQRAITSFQTLKEEHPAKADEFVRWAREERNLGSIKEAKGAVLRGVVKKIERLQQDGDAEGQQAPVEPDLPPQPETDPKHAPATPPAE